MTRGEVSGFAMAFSPFPGLISLESRRLDVPPESNVTASRRDQRLSGLWLRLIAFFKLLKATLLVGAGIGALGLLNPHFAKIITSWATTLAADRHDHLLDTLVTHVVDVDEKTLRLLSVGSFLYAMLFYTEGFGLFFDKRWAEFLTIVTTAGLIPFEVFELLRRVTMLKIEVLAANVSIVAYLAWRVTRKPDEVDAVSPARAVGYD
jgi:uncharacterized membrane protein (DUF2068 family)